jgi:predicted phosphoribosyltransferase
MGRPFLHDREQAGSLLSRKLEGYRNTNAIVIGIPHGGVCVAAPIAESLSMPLQVMSCRQINHPADPKRSIGSVSPAEACIHDDGFHNIPQDYVFHQIALIRGVFRYERKLYYGDNNPPSVQYKTVIVVVDVLKSSDALLACLREIKKQQPLKVIVAVPVAAAEAARVVRSEVDDIVFLQLEPSISSARMFFMEFPKVDENRVKELLEAGRRSARPVRQIACHFQS